MKSLMRLDPFRVIGRWDPFDELRTMQREMDRLFDHLVGGGRLGTAVQGGLWIPLVESYTKDGALHIKAELPGIDVKDLDISITDRELVIKGERKSEKDEKEREFTCREISYGAFERRFLLPEGSKGDELKATFTNGILEVTVPVAAMPAARKIEIETGEPKKIEAGTSAKKAA